MFGIYNNDSSLGYIIPSGAVVQIKMLWGFDKSSNAPGELFDVSMVVEKETTVVVALQELGEVYKDECEQKDLVPRDAYGYEYVAFADNDNSVRIYLGT